MKLSYNWVKKYWSMDGIRTPQEYIKKLDRAGLTLENTTYLYGADGKVSQDNIVWDIDIPEYRDDLLCMMWHAKESCGIFKKPYMNHVMYGHHIPSYDWMNEAIDERHNLFLSLTLHSYTDKCNYLLGQYIGKIDSRKKAHEFIRDEVYALGYESEDVFQDIQLYCARNCGEPVYILDAACLTDKEINVQEANEKGQITCKGVRYQYDKGDLIFVSGSRTIGIGGIIFADEALPGPDTKSVVVMSANMDKDCVKALMRKLGIQTFNGVLSSYGSNPKSIEKTIGNTTSYLYECADASLIEKETVMCRYDLQRRYIHASVTEINDILDADYTYEDIKETLENAEILTLLPDEDRDHFIVKLTSYNRDTCAADLAQRVINYDGYERIGKGDNHGKEI